MGPLSTREIVRTILASHTRVVGPYTYNGRTQNYVSEMCSCGDESYYVDHLAELLALTLHTDQGQERIVYMSDVKWCDLGDHAFKAGVEGSGGYTGTQYGPDGAAHQGRIDHCPNHKPGTFRALPAGRDEGVDEAPELYREKDAGLR